jgi:AraC-like DNA-binding protein
VTPIEHSTYFRPPALDGIEALHARFVRHAYRPHSHPTWTVAMGRARARLRERWDQRVTLVVLATVAGLSRFELIRRFREQNGVTPHAYQTNLRVEEARRLLTTGTAPAEVAAGCGFADQPHLTRVFRRAVGVTAGRYARAS